MTFSKTLRPSPPAELPNPDDSVLTFPGRDRTTLTVNLAQADQPEGAEQLREFCKTARAKGAVILTELIRREWAKKNVSL